MENNARRLVSESRRGARSKRDIDLTFLKLLDAGGLDVAREALRIFADDLTDESAARLKAVVDGADGIGWGGLA